MTAEEREAALDRLWTEALAIVIITPPAPADDEPERTNLP